MERKRTEMREKRREGKGEELRTLYVGVMRR